MLYLHSYSSSIILKNSLKAFHDYVPENALESQFSYPSHHPPTTIITINTHVESYLTVTRAIAAHLNIVFKKFIT